MVVHAVDVDLSTSVCRSTCSGGIDVLVGENVGRHIGLSVWEEVIDLFLRFGGLKFINCVLKGADADAGD